MAFKSNIEDIGVQIDPLSFNAEISVLWGNPVQTGNGKADGYMPSRDAVPCVLLPVIEVSDPEGMINGRQKLVNCFWYEGSPLADDSNLITPAKTGYEIVTTEGPEQYALKVRKNYEIDTAQIIHVKFSFLDPRTDNLIEIERQVVFRTVAYDENMLHVELKDCPSLMKIDPFDEQGCGDTPWMHSVSVQFMKGTLDYDDAKSTYKWQTFDYALSKYRDFTADEKQIFVSGVDTKKLTFDARFFEYAAFRCSVIPKDRPNWKMPLYASVAVDVRIAETINADIMCTKGLRINTQMTNEVSYECELIYNKGKVPLDKYGLFRIGWVAKDNRVGAVGKHVGEGKTCTFVPADYGFDCKHNTAVYAEIYMRRLSAVLVNNANKGITTNNGKVVIANVYH